MAPSDSQPRMRGRVFIAVGDVEQLQHIGAVGTLPLQRLADLDADGRGVVGKRHGAHRAAGVLERAAQPLGLRLLAALVEAFEGDQASGRHHEPRQASSCSSSSSVWRRRIVVHVGPSTSASGGSGRRR